MDKNQVVHCKIEPYDTYIGRGSIWGNPYSHKEGTKADFIVGSREEAVNKYYDHLIADPYLIKELASLENKVLGCWCKTPKNRNLLCHGDVLLYVQNAIKNKTPIYCFASNLAGRHGKGSALIAKDRWGARYGVGYGMMGQSFAIPTKNEKIQTLPLETVRKNINLFLNFAAKNEQYCFLTVKIGCGLAGFSEDQIKPLFQNRPSNVLVPFGWRE